jgi:hypothetical protein
MAQAEAWHVAIAIFRQAGAPAGWKLEKLKIQ